MPRKKCPYCYMYENGDIPDDREYLFDEEIYVERNTTEETNFTGTGELQGDVTTNERKITSKFNSNFIISYFLNICDDELYLCTDIRKNANELQEEKNIFCTCSTIKIKYCPMCGRKVTKCNSQERQQPT